jgi:hypothetical protein
LKRIHFFLSGVLATILTLSGLFAAAHSPAAQAQTVQKDYANHPNRAAIEYVVKNKLMWLYPDGNFRPEQPVTQADVVAGLVNVKGLTVGSSIQGFPANHWAKVYYERANKDGILNGVVINPNKVLTREETAFLMINAWQNVRNSRDNKETGAYKTAPNIQYAVGSRWMPKKAGKFPNGVSTTAYDGVTNATRGELAFGLTALRKDLIDIKESEKLALQVHNSFKISGKTLKGTLPSHPIYLSELIVGFKNGKIYRYSDPGNISLDITQVTYMTVAITRKDRSIKLATYQYLKIPNLTRIKAGW